MKGTSSNKLTIFTLSALSFGVVAGGLFPDYFAENLFIEQGCYWFVKLLKLLAIPVVFVSVVMGIINVGSFGTLGRIGFKTLFLFTVTTCIAVTMSLAVTTNLQLKLQSPDPAIGEQIPAPNLHGFIDSMIQAYLTNPLELIANGNMLHIILLSITIGILLTCTLPRTNFITAGLDWLHVHLLHLVVWFMNLAPLGAFCLMAKTFSTLGFDAIKPLSSYVCLVLGMYFMQVTIIYSSLLWFLARINPILYFKKLKNVWIVAISTASSNATLPVTLKTAEEELNIDANISSFTIPLGATLNMDAMACAYGVATVFLANTAGVHLLMVDYLVITLMTLVASIGTAGIPGVGLIALGMVLQQVHIPIGYLPFLIGVSRFTDMFGTAVNVTGDIVVSSIVAKSETSATQPKLAKEII